MTVSRGDEGRNLSHLFPVVIPLAMLDVQRTLGIGGRRGMVLAVLLVAGCAASMVHARWTILDSGTLRYGLVAVGTVLALAIAVLTVIGHALLVARAQPVTALRYE